MDAQVYVINVGQVSSDSREICLQVCSYDWSRMRGMSVCSETTSVSSESRSWGSQLLTMRNIKPTNMRRLATSATCKLTPYQSRFMDQPCQTQWATTSDSCVTSVFVHTLTMRAPKKWTGAGPIPKSLSSAPPGARQSHAFPHKMNFSMEKELLKNGAARSAIHQASMNSPAWRQTKNVLGVSCRRVVRNIGRTEPRRCPEIRCLILIGAGDQT
jgi:hypothetical protein